MSEPLLINNLNLVRKVQFTPALKQALKDFAHSAYDEIYHDQYVADYPSGQLADGADDIRPTFEHLWRGRVTQPLLAGYAFALPDADLDDLRSALREVGYLFGRQMGEQERDDYDDLEALCNDAFDLVFAQVEAAPA